MSGAAQEAGEPRRKALRAQERLNGIDYVEIGQDRRAVKVVLFRTPPEALSPDNIRVTGGVRVRDPAVREVRLIEPPDPDVERAVRVMLAEVGDSSVYRLQIQGVADFDPRYAGIDFTFEASGPGGIQLDCRAGAAPLSPPPPSPELDYLAKDYAGFRRLAFDRLAQILPGWSERHVPDIGVTLVEMMAYVGDQLSYQQDAVATEAYLGTARLRTSVRRHARLIDYIMHEGCNARAWVQVQTVGDVTMPPGDLGFAVGDEDPPENEFWPVDPGPIALYAAQNEIAFHAWGDGDRSLLRGATRATLRDAETKEGRALDSLAPGQALLIEVVATPGGEQVMAASGSGQAVAASGGGQVMAASGGGQVDPSLRHVVRLRQVTRGEDPLLNHKIVEIAWAEEDALPFEAPLPSPTDAPPPALVAVARGNLILADHGRQVRDEIVPPRRLPDAKAPAAFDRGPRRPRLRQAGLVFRQAIDPTAPASASLHQDPRQAVPLLLSLSGPTDPALGLNDGAPQAWQTCPDLIESTAEDCHVVVEMDDDGLAVLRFGDGRRGARPGEAAFLVSYRVGNGPAGNVGAETITRVLTREAFVEGLSCRNPLPAVGGLPPEPVADVKLLAPGVFRARRERAVTAQDYARAAEEVFGVRRAAADISQLGALRLVEVSILPQHGDDPSPELLARVEAHLSPRKRIGHDLHVGPARMVALDVGIMVSVQGDYLRSHVLDALRRALGSGMRPDGEMGFFHPDRMSFGNPVHGSRIVAAAQSVTGVEWVRLTRLRRLEDAPPDDPEMTRRAATSLVLDAFEVARMDNDAEHPERGRLSIDLRGGR